MKTNESIQDSFPLGRWNSGALIGNPDEGGASIHRRRDSYQGPGRRVPRGILETVAQGLRQLARVDVNPDLRLWKCDRERMLGQSGPKPRNRGFDDLRACHHLAARAGGAGVKADDLHELADTPGQRL